MLSAEEIRENKEQFIQLMEELNKYREYDVELFKSVLERGHFFEAPYNVEGPYSYEGGLCELSLKVVKKFSEISSKDTLTETELVLGLFSQIYRMDLFEKYTKNVKVYSPNGKKYDELGKFDWQATYAYTYKEVGTREYAIGGEALSLMLVQDIIPLTSSEVTALLYSAGGMDKGYIDKNVTNTFIKKPIVVLLHCAILMALYAN